MDWHLIYTSICMTDISWFRISLALKCTLNKRCYNVAYLCMSSFCALCPMLSMFLYSIYKLPSLNRNGTGSCHDIRFDYVLFNRRLYSFIRICLLSTVAAHNLLVFTLYKPEVEWTRFDKSVGHKRPYNISCGELFFWIISSWYM